MNGVLTGSNATHISCYRYVENRYEYSLGRLPRSCKFVSVSPLAGFRVMVRRPPGAMIGLKTRLAVEYVQKAQAESGGLGVALQEHRGAVVVA